MRSALLPIAAWLGVLQSLAPPTSAPDQAMRLVGIASMLGSLTVLVYRLGTWRQQMENTRHNVGEQVNVFRTEMTACFDRIERRLDRLEDCCQSSCHSEGAQRACHPEGAQRVCHPEGAQRPKDRLL